MQPTTEELEEATHLGWLAKVAGQPAASNPYGVAFAFQPQDEADRYYRLNRAWHHGWYSAERFTTE